MIPTRVMRLWSPESAEKYWVAVRWPRYLWAKDFATLGEVVRSHNPQTLERAGAQEARRIRRRRRLTSEALIDTLAHHSAHAGVRRAVRYHSNATELVLAALAVTAAGNGVEQEPEVPDEFMAAALSMGSWSTFGVSWMSEPSGEELRDLSTVALRLLDPDVREAFEVLAQDWAGTLSEVVTACETLV